MPVRFKPPFYPIIFVRGYCGSANAVEEAVADPYMGLNAGSTKIRQLWTGEVGRYFFESPLIRLMKDHGYRDVFADGAALTPGTTVPPESIVIHRYYDAVSKDFGTNSSGEIEGYAEELARLVLKLRDQICQKDEEALAAFRVYLVAHSMGGLVCRCFLQNNSIGLPSEQMAFASARSMVDKVFTYATPHNGIDLQLLGNVPSFLSANHVDNFNRNRMRQYLALPKPKTSTESVASLNGAFDPNRMFCLVGTNNRDYEVAAGMSRRVVGPMSDGLVTIENATAFGPNPSPDPEAEAVIGCPRAFVHRAHSGTYGIVNSEEGYQNLKRFLFGNVRVDGELEVTSISLPPAVRAQLDLNVPVNASYTFETTVRTRGALWALHRRVAEDGSAAFAMYKDLIPKAGAERRRPHLFSAFLSIGERKDLARTSLGFSVDLGILVPQYEVGGTLFLKDHYEGGYIFRDKLNLEAFPPAEAGGSWDLHYGFDRDSPNQSPLTAPIEVNGTGYRYRIPIIQTATPGIVADLILTPNAWK